MRKRFYAVLPALLLLVGAAVAQIVGSLPFNLQNNTPADATQVMANFNAIVSGTNANGAKNGVNTDITQLSALSTPLTRAQGGTQTHIATATAGGSANAQTIAATSPYFRVELWRHRSIRSGRNEHSRDDARRGWHWSHRCLPSDILGAGTVGRRRDRFRLDDSRALQWHTVSASYRRNSRCSACDGYLHCGVDCGPWLFAASGTGDLAHDLRCDLRSDRHDLRRR